MNNHQAFHHVFEQRIADVVVSMNVGQQLNQRHFTRKWDLFGFQRILVDQPRKGGDCLVEHWQLFGIALEGAVHNGTVNKQQMTARSC